MIYPHPLVTRLQSVTLRCHGILPGLKACIDSLPPNLPWSQLRSLTVDIHLDLDLIFGILQQTPMLEALNLATPISGVPGQLTMSSLRNLIIVLDPTEFNATEFDQILRSFICPSLTKLSLIMD